MCLFTRFVLLVLCSEQFRELFWIWIDPSHLEPFVYELLACHVSKLSWLDLLKLHLAVRGLVPDGIHDVLSSLDTMAFDSCLEFVFT